MKRWLRRLRAVFRRDAVERELDREMELHLELETQQNLRAGMTPEEARRQAHIAFGGVERYKQQTREARMFDWTLGMSLDFKLGARMLVKHPGLAFVGAVGMAVGVAIAAVSYSVIETITDAALPLDQGDRIVTVQNLDALRGGQVRETHLHELGAWRDQLDRLEELGAYRTVNRNLIAADGRIESVRVAEMSASGFRVASVPALIGRYFTEEDEHPAAPAVVVIGYSLWQTRFSGAPDVVGRTVRLGATDHTIVGVMPEGFGFPVNNRVWIPFHLDPLAFEQGHGPELDVFARLAPGWSIEQARTQADAIAARLAADDPEAHGSIRTQILPFARAFLDTPQLVWVFYLVQVAVSMILVLIGINFAVLIYARTAMRTGEIAVRTALGASRARVVTQLFAEALVLSSLAAAIGLGAAYYVLERVNGFIAFLGGEQVPFWWRFGLSGGTVLYAAGLAILAAVIVGVVPALKATSIRVQATLQSLSSAGGTLQLGRRWTTLIVAQVAIAVAVLPIPLSAFAETLGLTERATPISTRDFLMASLYLDPADASSAGGASDENVDDRFAVLRAEVMRRLEAEPEVTAVVVAEELGPAGGGWVEVDQGRMEAEVDLHATQFMPVDVGFFRAFGIRVQSGRDFQAADTLPEANAVIVNRVFVDEVLGGADPIGRRFRFPAPRDDDSAEPGPWLEIVGLIGNVASSMGRSTATPMFYRPLATGSVYPLGLAIRLRGTTPAEFGNRVRALAMSVDPMLRFGTVAPLDDVVWKAAEDTRILELVVAALSLSALLLSGAGISALMSFTVTQRRREIGIRLALGAARYQVIFNVLRRALRQVGIGLALGALGSMLLFKVAGQNMSPKDLMLLVINAALMVVVGVVAAIAPARRGLEVEPTEALKAE
jgi:predicted permease